MNRVLTPAACARATIDGTLPPLDWLMYQIHIPWPSNAVPLTAPAPPEAAVGGFFGAGGCRARWTTGIGPKGPAWRGLEVSTMMRPECAPLGTVAIRPSGVWRRREPGELRLIRAPKARGKTTTIPAF